MKQKINLAITMVLLGGAALPVVFATTSRIVDNNEHEWTISETPPLAPKIRNS